MLIGAGQYRRGGDIDAASVMDTQFLRLKIIGRFTVGSNGVKFPRTDRVPVATNCGEKNVHTN